MKDSSLVQEVAEVIGLHEDLMGQEKLVDVFQHLQNQNTFMVGDFYKIVSANKSANNESSKAYSAANLEVTLLTNRINKQTKELEETKSIIKNKKTSRPEKEAALNKKGELEHAIAVSQAKLEKEQVIYQRAKGELGRQAELTRNHLDSYFNQHGIDIQKFESNPEQFIAALKEDGELENNVEKQMGLYFLAYAYKEGLLKNKNVTEEHVSQTLNVLMGMQFTPAYTLQMSMGNFDPSNAPKVSLEGAKLGDMRCQYRIAQDYLSHLASTAGQNNPPPYTFPEGTNREEVVGWIKNARDKGSVQAIGNMSLFIGNFFGAAGANYQDNVTPEQKERLREMGELVQAISGDDKINNYVEEVLNLKGTPDEIKQRYKEIRQETDEHLFKEYHKPFNRTPEKVDGVLNNAEVFWKFSLAHAIKQLINSENAENKSPDAKSFLASANNSITTLIGNISDSTATSPETSRMISELQSKAETSSVSDSFKGKLKAFAQSVIDNASALTKSEEPKSLPREKPKGEDKSIFSSILTPISSFTPFKSMKTSRSPSPEPPVLPRSASVPVDKIENRGVMASKSYPSPLWKKAEVPTMQRSYSNPEMKGSSEATSSDVTPTTSAPSTPTWKKGRSPASSEPSSPREGSVEPERDDKPRRRF